MDNCNREIMLEILKDTRDYYAENPAKRRAIDKDNNCHYTWGDTHCAIGRYLKDDFKTEGWYDNNESVEDLRGDGDDIDWCLIENVHGIYVEFWADLQEFHDSRENWKDDDISDSGKARYVRFQDRIAGGSYD